MREIIKKVFSSRIFIQVLGGILTIFIIGIINSLAEKINLWKSLLNLPVKIYHIKIPDFIILIFVLIIVIWLILINNKFQGLSPKKFKEMLAEEEILLVLKTLAGNASRYAERGGLNVVYDRAFEGKTQADFNIVLSMLHASGQIKTSKPPNSDERIHITDSGLLYYNRHRKRLKKK